MARSRARGWFVATGSTVARVALVVSVVLALASTSAFAVDVRGSLTVPSDYPSSMPAETDAQRARSRYWEEWNGFLDPRPARLDVQREIAVVLTGEGAPSTGEQPPLRIHNGSLWPSTLVGRAGQAMQIVNGDGCAYELFAEGNTEFAAIQTAPGNARPVTVSAAGNWPVRDRNYQHVQGHLHVLADLVARAFVEANGSYTFRGVAAGHYTLRVLHGAREVHSAEIDVPEGHEFSVPAIPITAAAAAAAQ